MYAIFSILFNRHAIRRFIDQTISAARRAMQFRSDVIRNARVTTDGAIARKSRAEVGIFTIEDLPSQPGRGMALRAAHLASLRRA